MTKRPKKGEKGSISEEARLNAKDLKGWPRTVPYHPNADPNIHTGRRTSQEMPRATVNPAFGPKPVNSIIQKVIGALADYATYGKVEPDPTNAYPSTPPDPQKANSRFKEIVRQIEERQRTPQLKVRSASKPKKG